MHRPILFGSLSLISVTAVAHDPVGMITVSGRDTNLVGRALSASEGVIGRADIAGRPLLRPGEVMELVPGLAATQHSGSGKANQYFMRGFNLDHGTDLATSIDYMPVNLRTHGHGQGYTDLTFLIPEVIDQLTYRKGPYAADVGDFSSAGSVALSTAHTLERGQARLTAGENGYARLLLADDAQVSGGDFLYALEAQRYDGPWSDIDENVRKYNALLKFGREAGDGWLSVNAMAYDNGWNSSDQIPGRAVTSGLIDALGSIDSGPGGQSSRYSLSASWEALRWTLAAYAIDYDLTLGSNFTYFLDDPVNGDQFEQVDDRRVYGGTAHYDLQTPVGGWMMHNTFGVDLRMDDIANVGLYKTADRTRLGAVRLDAVNELSGAVYWQNRYQWNGKLRSTLGARYDRYRFRVDPRIALNVHGVDVSANHGRRDDGIASVKAALAYTFNRRWEAYAAAGQGFHSNDARGTVTTVDPVDGTSIAPVDPLVRSRGAEVGARAFWTDRLNASLSLWTLEMDSELLFVGDAGNTEPSRRSQRRGMELTVYYQFNDVVNMDLEYATTLARFREPDPTDASLGNHIPGAVRDMLQAGVYASFPRDTFATLRLRYFGPRPLDENNAVRSSGSTVVNLLAGKRWEKFSLQAELLNLLDSRDHDIDYFYASRLPGEAAEGVEDLHYHMMEPRTFRLTLGMAF